MLHCNLFCHSFSQNVKCFLLLKPQAEADIDRKYQALPMDKSRDLGPDIVVTFGISGLNYSRSIRNIVLARVGRWKLEHLLGLAEQVLRYLPNTSQPFWVLSATMGLKLKSFFIGFTYQTFVCGQICVAS